MVIADKTYRSVRHCPRQETGSSVDDLFNIDFRRVRNRRERFFGHLDKHKLLHYNQHSKEFLKSAFGLLWNSECVDWRIRPRQLYLTSLTLLDVDHPIVQDTCNSTQHNFLGVCNHDTKQYNLSTVKYSNRSGL